MRAHRALARSFRAGRKIVNIANPPVCRTRARGKQIRRGERSDAAPLRRTYRAPPPAKQTKKKLMKKQGPAMRIQNPSPPSQRDGPHPAGRAAQQPACARRRTPAARRSGITRPAQPLEELPQITTPQPRPLGAGPLFQSGKGNYEHRRFPCLQNPCPRRANPPR